METLFKWDQLVWREAIDCAKRLGVPVLKVGVPWAKRQVGNGARVSGSSLVALA